MTIVAGWQGGVQPQLDLCPHCRTPLRPEDRARIEQNPGQLALNTGDGDKGHVRRRLNHALLTRLVGPGRRG